MLFKNSMKYVKKKKVDALPKSKLKVIPLGGLNEVGKNMTVLEYEDDIIVIDCGLGSGCGYDRRYGKRQNYRRG